MKDCPNWYAHMNGTQTYEEWRRWMCQILDFFTKDMMVSSTQTCPHCKYRHSTYVSFGYESLEVGAFECLRCGASFSTREVYGWGEP